MKKIAIAMMAVLAMFAGIGCGGSSASKTWTEASKASFKKKALKNASKIGLTADRSACMADWVISTYASEADFESSYDDDASKALIIACVWND